MAIYPIEIRRCRHIKTNGTQCGSPAVKDKELCYYHEKNQPKTVELYIDGERYSDSQLWLPVFEDAYSIQTVIRQVVQLLLARRIERKDASLLLYALQIASSNLKTMQAEKAKPTQVVVEPEKAAETPLGMTQWSANGPGHDLEDTSRAKEVDWSSLGRPPSAQECHDAMCPMEKVALIDGLEKMGTIRKGAMSEAMFHGGPDPLLPAMKQLREDYKRRSEL
ncbi:MAG: hypothetical protein WCF61_01160 [Terriglobales bacterium]